MGDTHVCALCVMFTFLHSPLYSMYELVHCRRTSAGVSLLLVRVRYCVGRGEIILPVLIFNII